MLPVRRGEHVAAIEFVAAPDATKTDMPLRAGAAIKQSHFNIVRYSAIPVPISGERTVYGSEAFASAFLPTAISIGRLSDRMKVGDFKPEPTETVIPVYGIANCSECDIARATFEWALPVGGHDNAPISAQYSVLPVSGVQDGLAVVQLDSKGDDDPVKMGRAGRDAPDQGSAQQLVYAPPTLGVSANETSVHVVFGNTEHIRGTWSCVLQPGTAAILRLISVGSSAMEVYMPDDDTTTQLLVTIERLSGRYGGTPHYTDK